MILLLIWLVASAQDGKETSVTEIGNVLIAEDPSSLSLSDIIKSNFNELPTRIDNSEEEVTFLILNTRSRSFLVPAAESNTVLSRLLPQEDLASAEDT